MRFTRTLVVSALAVGLGGCSFLFVRGPPEDHERLNSFDCTTSAVAPVIDLAIAATDFTGALISASTASDLDDPGDRNNAEAMAVVAIAEGILFGLSAIHGFNETSDCRGARGDLHERLARIPPGGPGCSMDTDCKGSRVCQGGLCVEPSAGVTH